VASVYDEAGVESLLAGFLRIECRHRRVERRRDPFTSAPRHHLRARRCRLHADGTSRLERPKELMQDIFAISFGDDQQRVGGEHGIAADAHTVATCVGLAEMLSKPAPVSKSAAGQRLAECWWRTTNRLIALPTLGSRQ
jgi:hypothetical protein